jgi:hypothetical protein
MLTKVSAFALILAAALCFQVQAGGDSDSASAAKEEAEKKEGTNPAEEPKLNPETTDAANEEQPAAVKDESDSGDEAK